MKPTMVEGLARHTSCAKSKVAQGKCKSSSTLKTAAVSSGSNGRNRLFNESTSCSSYSSRGVSPVRGKRLEENFLAAADGIPSRLSWLLPLLLLVLCASPDPSKLLRCWLPTILLPLSMLLLLLALFPSILPPVAELVPSNDVVRPAVRATRNPGTWKNFAGGGDASWSDHTTCTASMRGQLRYCGTTCGVCKLCR